MYAEVALVAYLIDRIFGEFRFIRHPVIVMGDYITWFEKRFYKDDISRGVLLASSLIVLTFIISLVIQIFLSTLYPLLSTLFLGVLASPALASKMLYDSVKEVITHPEMIRYLVSRDTDDLSRSDINKAAVETYAENLSDGVIAPLFYLVLFGLPGAYVYKAINTLDSMVGYRNDRYEKFGKFAAKLDDVANYIPARITAILIVLLMQNQRAGTRPAPTPHNQSVAKQRIPQLLPSPSSLLIQVFRNGKLHNSPNAGYPIAATAYALGIKLGGPTRYFGTLKPKAYFGKGRKAITTEDIKRALTLQPKLDIVLIVILGIGAWL